MMAGLKEGIDQTCKYAPFGSIDYSEGTSDNTHQFTGKEIDEESGLSYFGARYYNPEIGRWISRDSDKGQIGFPITLNRYQYCRNNPLSYVDKDGRYSITFDKADETYDMQLEGGLGFGQLNAGVNAVPASAIIKTIFCALDRMIHPGYHFVEAAEPLQAIIGNENFIKGLSTVVTANDLVSLGLLGRSLNGLPTSGPMEGANFALAALGAAATGSMHGISAIAEEKLENYWIKTRIPTTAKTKQEIKDRTKWMWEKMTSGVSPQEAAKMYGEEFGGDAKGSNEE